MALTAFLRADDKGLLSDSSTACLEMAGLWQWNVHARTKEAQDISGLERTARAIFTANPHPMGMPLHD